MASEDASGTVPSVLIPDRSARRRGRLGLAIPWENLPWWGIITLLVGVFVGYSALTSTRYVDAMTFILDLPWDRDVISKGQTAQDGTWVLTVTPAMAPGTYSLYADVLNKTGESVASTPIVKVVVPEGAPEREGPPLPIAGETTTPVQVQTSTPSFTGRAPAGTQVLLYDDYAGNVWRIIRHMAAANGVLLTVRTTLIAFAGALILGLLMGMMRVSQRSPDLTIHAGRRLLIGIGLMVIILILWPTSRSLEVGLPVAAGMEALMFLLPAMPYTLSTLYVEIVRGVPMLVIILYMGFAITPALRAATGEVLDLRGLPAAVIGLSFGYGAYLAEVYRAGIQSIPEGQMEAARSLGMSYIQAMRYVVLPQAIRVVLPPLGNDFVSMLKDSSLISVIALPEVLQQGRLWVSRNFRAFEGFNSVMLLYLVMTLLLSLVVRSVERKTALPGR
jgi:polar amino acid transport system permease protein